jgi:hypothetical protein
VPDATGIFQKVAADGTTSAVFPGGIELRPRGLFQIPENVPARTIRWVDAQAGLVAYIDDMYDPNPAIGNTLSMKSYGPKGNIQFVADTKRVTAIDETGSSDFMQWSATSNLKVRTWSVQFGALAAAQEVGGPVSLPWTTALYLIGAFAVVGGSVSNSGPQLCSWAYFPNTPGSFIIAIRNNSPYGMATPTNFLQGIALYS